MRPNPSAKNDGGDSLDFIQQKHTEFFALLYSQ